MLHHDALLPVRIDLLHQPIPVDHHPRAEPVVVGPVLVPQVGGMRDGVAEPGLGLDPLDNDPADGDRFQQADVGRLRVAVGSHLLLAAVRDIGLIQLLLQNLFVLYPNITK